MNTLRGFSGTLAGLAVCIGLDVRGQVFTSGFEVWAIGLPVDWLGDQTTISTDDIWQVTGDAYSGSYAVRLVQPVSGLTYFTSEPMHLDSGNHYLLSYWAKGNGVVAPCLFGIDIDGGTFPCETVDVATETWQYYTVEFNCYHTSDIAEIMFILAITYAPDHLMIDDVSLVLNNPPPPPSLSIQQIQTPQGGTSNSPYLGSAVATSGIVTAITLEGYQYYIQNGTGPYSGVLVSEFTGAALQLGDSVRVTGNVSESEGETLLACNNGYELLASGSPMPTPEVLTLPLADREPWEGVLATVENVACLDINTNDSWDGTVNSSVDVVIGAQFFASAVAVGSTYNVTDILHYVWPTDRLEPRAQEDVTEVVGIEEAEREMLRCFPNPASEVIQVELQDGSQKPFVYELIDATGKVASSGITNAGLIDVSQLNEGLYVLRTMGFALRFVVRH